MISVIIPAYNVAPLLERCYQSIQTQTYKDFEVILIDDGSTDQTPEICEELAKNNANTRVVHQKSQVVTTCVSLTVMTMWNRNIYKVCIML